MNAETVLLPELHQKEKACREIEIQRYHHNAQLHQYRWESLAKHVLALAMVDDLLLNILGSTKLKRSKWKRLVIRSAVKKILHINTSVCVIVVFFYCLRIQTLDMCLKSKFAISPPKRKVKKAPQGGSFFTG